MTSEDARVRGTIREVYGTRALSVLGGSNPEAEARAGDAACCGGACCGDGSQGSGCGSQAELYDPDQLLRLPGGAIDASAGCGNPTAIAEIRPGETVLDLGAGGGIDCFLAAEQTGSGGLVIGVDMTPAMVELARHNLSELGLGNVEFRLGEIEALPVADGSVDVIISNCVINLSTDKDRVLREAWRVLRPGGRLRISDMVWAGARPPEGASAEDWAGCVAGAESIETYMERLQRAGFKGTHVESVSELPEQGGLASAVIAADKE